MPRVKIDYVVSFSSENGDNKANNLLLWDISPKKKWLSKKGELSCSVVLQLARAVKICAVDVGAYQAALVEVLVGRAEAPEEPFKVLVPRSVFLSPADSRNGQQPDRVRSFRGTQLCSDATSGSQLWDRVRVVCSQPYNKHCNYGLSFIHIFEPESDHPMWNLPATSTKQLLNFKLPSSSDEEEFKPGELFAMLGHKTITKTDNTGSQIKQATANALNGAKDTRTQLVKTGIGQTKTAPADTVLKPVAAEDSVLKPVAAKDSEVLRGVVFALSGYENPRRAALRQTGIRMGARYEPTLSSRCTHLVCAFKGTPKMRKMGASCVAVRGQWLDECWRRKRLLPAADFPPGAPSPPPVQVADDSDGDTDDEIDKVLQKRMPPDANAYGDNTDTEEDREGGGGVGGRGWLPDFFEGRTFVVADDVEREGYDRRLLLRYICAYGGTVLPQQLEDEDTDDCLVISTAGTRGTRSPEWLWRCHEAQRLLN